MNTTLRRQLTLFVDPRDAENIERVRKTFNQLQYELIKCHVTLCREDELLDLDVIITNLESLTDICISIEFGEVLRVSDGKGVLLPGKGDNDEFRELRKQILHGLNIDPMRQEPHITLMHPRNSTCTDHIFEEIQKIKIPSHLEFNHISLIEQKDGGPWEVLRNFGSVKS